MANANLAILISARDTASPHFKNMSNELGGLSKAGDAAGMALKAGLVAGIAAAVAAAGAMKVFGIDAVKMASDVSESANKVGVIFGDTAGEVEAFASTAAASMGQSKGEALAAAATFGNLFSTIGMGKAEVTSMSMEVVKLGSDLASFHNIKPEEALEKLRAGLVGEAEPLRSMGILINETTMKAKAMEMGLVAVNGELSEAQKVQARYAMILDQTQAAQGDFARTSDGMANATRIIEASFKDLQTAIGDELLPVVAPLISDFAQAIPGAMDQAKPYIEEFGDRLGVLIDLAKVEIPAAIGTAQEIIGDFQGQVDEAGAAVAATAGMIGITTDDVLPLLGTALKTAELLWIDFSAGASDGEFSIGGAAGAAGRAIGDFLGMAGSMLKAAGAAQVLGQFLAILPGASPVTNAAWASVADAWSRAEAEVAAAQARMAGGDDAWWKLGAGAAGGFEVAGVAIEKYTEKYKALKAEALSNRAIDAQNRAWEAADREMGKVATSAGKAAPAIASAGAASKGAGGAADKAAKELEKLSDAFDKTEGEFGDIVNSMNADITNLTQDYGDRWIEKWHEVDAAIKETQRSAQQAIISLWSQDQLQQAITQQRTALDTFLSGIQRARSQQMEDARNLWAYEKTLGRSKEDYEKTIERTKEDAARAIGKAQTEEEKQRIREQLAEQLESMAISNRRQREDQETANRRQLDDLADRRKQEEDDAKWLAENVTKPKAELERRLHDEEMQRRKEAIEKDRDDRITAINAEWEEWQATEKAKLLQSAADAKTEAQNKLIAVRDGYLSKLGEASQSGIDDLKARLEAAFGAAFGMVGSSGQNTSGTSGTDPDHAPGGATYEAWAAGGRYDPTNSGGEPDYSYPAMDLPNFGYTFDDAPVMDGGGRVPGRYGALVPVLARGGEQFGGWPPRNSGGNITVDMRGAVVYGVSNLKDLVVEAVVDAQRRGRLS